MIEFLDNKYTKIYYSIVDAAKDRTVLSGYSEVHHIIPKSLGGSNRKENLVAVTPNEHFICHRLLPKMTSGNSKSKMIYAIRRMVQRSLNHRTTCQHCNRTFANNMYARFHGDKCKDKK